MRLKNLPIVSFSVENSDDWGAVSAIYNQDDCKKKLDDELKVAAKVVLGEMNLRVIKHGSRIAAFALLEKGQVVCSNVSRYFKRNDRIQQILRSEICTNLESFY